MLSQKKYIELVSAITEHIESNLQSLFGVEDACAISPLSLWQTQRIFRATTGDSISNYIRGRKLTHSLKHLSQYSISEVASTYGYGTLESYSRAFRRYFGLSPTAFLLQKSNALHLKKPYLNYGKIEVIARNISKNPVYQFQKAKHLIGLPIEIPSPFLDNSQFNESLLVSWKDFLKMPKHGLNIVGDRWFGLTPLVQKVDVYSVVRYYLSVEVCKAPSSLPSNWVSIEIPATKYAVFEIKGPINICNIVTDYIFGIWLPSNGDCQSIRHVLDFYEKRLFSVQNSQSLFYRMVAMDTL